MQFVNVTPSLYVLIQKMLKKNRAAFQAKKKRDGSKYRIKIQMLLVSVKTIIIIGGTVPS